MSAAPKLGIPKKSAALYFPELALQLLLRERPDFRGYPLALVDDVMPSAPIKTLSKSAYHTGLRPGIRQGAARDLVLNLRTAITPEAEVEQWMTELMGALGLFSSHTVRIDDGFFLDPVGLSHMSGGFRVWVECVKRYLEGRDVHARLVVGFDKYRAFAVARRDKLFRAEEKVQVLCLKSAEEEEMLCRDAELCELNFPEKLREPLSLLGIETLGEFLELPREELLTRFGKDAHHLYTHYAGHGQLPLKPTKTLKVKRICREILPPTKHLEPLLFSVKSTLDPLLKELNASGEKVRSLHLDFHQERFGHRKLRDEELNLSTEIEPTLPTTDVRILMDLVRLHLTQLHFLAPVEELAVTADTVFAEDCQFTTAPKRDFHAAAEALNQVAARYGAHTICTPSLSDTHLPKTPFVWKRANPNSLMLNAQAATGQNAFCHEHTLAPSGDPRNSSEEYHAKKYTKILSIFPRREQVTSTSTKCPSGANIPSRVSPIKPSLNTPNESNSEYHAHVSDTCSGCRPHRLGD